jgi:hypothetical protein
MAPIRRSELLSRIANGNVSPDPGVSAATFFEYPSP